MKFCLIDEADKDDSLGAVEELDVRDVTSHVGTHVKALDKADSHSIGLLSEKLSCTPSKNRDDDSIAEIVEELDLGFDDLIGLNNDAGDGEGAITPITSNKTLGHETEGSEREDVPRDKFSIKTNQEIPPRHKDKMASLPQHLQSLLINLSQARAHRRVLNSPDK
jgi:hypothetical protein